MPRFEPISTNDECGVPAVVRKRGVRQKLVKDGHSLWAEGLLSVFCVDRRLRTAEGTRRSSRLEYRQNPLSYSSSYLRIRPLSMVYNPYTVCGSYFLAIPGSSEVYMRTNAVKTVGSSKAAPLDMEATPEELQGFHNLVLPWLKKAKTAQKNVLLDPDSIKAVMRCISNRLYFLPEDMLEQNHVYRKANIKLALEILNSGKIVFTIQKSGAPEIKVIFRLAIVPVKMTLKRSAPGAKAPLPSVGFMVADKNAEYFAKEGNYFVILIDNSSIEHPENKTVLLTQLLIHDILHGCKKICEKLEAQKYNVVEIGNKHPIEKEALESITEEELCQAYEPLFNAPMPTVFNNDGNAQTIGSLDKQIVENNARAHNMPYIQLLDGSPYARIAKAVLQSQ